MFPMRGTKELQRGLLTLIASLPGGVMVEVGSFSGESTIEFAKKFEKVFAVDPWDDHVDQILNIPMAEVEKAFDTRVGPYPNILKMKMTSALASSSFEDKSLGFVYIDANHEYVHVCEDIALWKNKVIPGGYLGGHDYHAQVFPGVVRAVGEHFETTPQVFEDTSWLVRLG